jgi:hypothetical protein
MKRSTPDAAPMPHRVRRLVWRARLAGDEDAPALRRLLHEQQDTVEAVLDAELGTIDDGPVRRVRRLELTLAAVSLQALADELPQRLGPALRLAWAAAQSGAPAQTDELATPSDTTADARDWLLHMLDSGRLPWPLAGLSPDHVRTRLQEAAKTAAQGAFDPVFAQHAAAPPGPDERVAWVARFLALLPPATRTAWLDAASPWWSEVPAARLKAVLQWRRQALRAGLNVQRVDALTGSLLLLARTGPWPPAEDWSAWARTLGEPIAKRGTPMRRPWASPQAPAHAGTQEAAQTSAGTSSPRPRWPDDDTEAGLLLPMAGLVLLHPFLPRLLQGLGLAMPGTAMRPLSVDSLQRALPLLHALATGGDEVQEFELGGAKLLLGLDPGRPLSFALQPASPPERTEADALLDAAIGHWPALRGTGREGLRTSFLQRRGLLRRGDGGPVLTLQSEPFDLLLNTLPWGLGLVKLPWMPEPLHVEWPMPR